MIVIPFIMQVRFFFSSRRLHTRCALVTGVQTCALPIYREAYRQLLTEVTPYLRSSARRMGIPPAEIEDAVQDVLLTIHVIRHTFDPARPFGQIGRASCRERVCQYV